MAPWTYVYTHANMHLCACMHVCTCRYTQACKYMGIYASNARWVTPRTNIIRRVARRDTKCSHGHMHTQRPQLKSDGRSPLMRLRRDTRCDETCLVIILSGHLYSKGPSKRIELTLRHTRRKNTLMFNGTEAHSDHRWISLRRCRTTLSGRSKEALMKCGPSSTMAAGHTL